MKTLLLFALLSTATMHAQNEGLWEGYNGGWSLTSRQLLALAKATPAEKFSWRSTPGVRSRLARCTAYRHHEFLSVKRDRAEGRRCRSAWKRP